MSQLMLGVRSGTVRRRAAGKISTIAALQAIRKALAKLARTRWSWFGCQVPNSGVPLDRRKSRPAIYDNDCPNEAGTRANLLPAFAEIRGPAIWIEWDRSSPNTPAEVRQFGSPAILVNRKDVSGYAPHPGAACRLYSSPHGTRSDFA